MELKNGEWRTFSPSQQRLQRLIKKHNPKNVYISVNKFLYYNEHPQWRHQNKLLEHYALIDIDGQNFNNPDECKQYFIDIQNLLKDNKIHIEKIVCTNTTLGGYQIHIQPCCRDKFLNLLEKTPKCFSSIDSRVNDIKRVSRMENTFNGNRNCVSFEIPKDLNNSEIMNGNHISPYFLADGTYSPLARFNVEVPSMSLPKQANAGFPALGMPQIASLSQDYFEADDSGLAEMRNPSRTEQQGRQAIKSKLPSYFMVKEMKSNVYGTKTLVPVLKFNKKPSKRLIRRLQALNIGNLYLFQNHQDYALISPKCCQMGQLQRIYKKVKCYKSLIELQKFKTNWIILSNIHDLEQKKNIDTFKFIDFYHQATGGWCSYSHLLFLNKYHKQEYNNVIGKEPKIYNAIFSTK